MLQPAGGREIFWEGWENRAPWPAQSSRLSRSCKKISRLSQGTRLALPNGLPCPAERAVRQGQTARPATLCAPARCSRGLKAAAAGRRAAGGRRKSPGAARCGPGLGCVCLGGRRQSASLALMNSRFRRAMLAIDSFLGHSASQARVLVQLRAWRPRGGPGAAARAGSPWS